MQINQFRKWLAAQFDGLTLEAFVREEGISTKGDKGDTGDPGTNAAFLTGTATFSTPNYTATVANFPGYSDGLLLWLNITGENDGACNLNVNGLGAHIIVKSSEAGLTNLKAQDIGNGVVGGWCMFQMRATGNALLPFAFQLLSPSAQAARIDDPQVTSHVTANHVARVATDTNDFVDGSIIDDVAGGTFDINTTSEVAALHLNGNDNTAQLGAGDVYIKVDGNAGTVIMPNLPGSDPGVAGGLYVVAGVLMVSDGTH